MTALAQLADHPLGKRQVPRSTRFGYAVVVFFFLISTRVECKIHFRAYLPGVGAVLFGLLVVTDRPIVFVSSPRLLWQERPLATTVSNPHLDAIPGRRPHCSSQSWLAASVRYVEQLLQNSGYLGLSAAASRILTSL